MRAMKKSEQIHLFGSFVGFILSRNSNDFIEKPLLNPNKNNTKELGFTNEKKKEV